MAPAPEQISAEARAAAEWLLSEFAWRVDQGEGARVAELFTDDAIVETPHFRLAGRAAIDDWFTSRASKGDRLSRHFWTNLRIEDLGQNRMVVRANAMTLVGAPPAPFRGAKLAAGTSTDTLARGTEGWRFSSRRLEIAFEGEVQPIATGH